MTGNTCYVLVQIQVVTDRVLATCNNINSVDKAQSSVLTVVPVLTTFACLLRAGVRPQHIRDCFIAMGV